MGFEGYKIKNKLTVFQNFQDRTDPASVYAKTFDITLYVSTAGTKFVRFDVIESSVKQTLGKYSEKVLRQFSPFDQLEPTLENMGNVFYQMIKNDLIPIGVTLEMLEINENPLRTFIVSEANSDKRLLLGEKRVRVSSLLMGNIISQATTNILSGQEKPEESLVPIQFAPEPEEEEEEKELPPVLVLPVKCEANLTVPDRKASGYAFGVGFLWLVVCGVLVALYLKNTGAYPSGGDIFGHLFKSDLLYNSIKNGNFYPLNTSYWYNGMQPFRYWAPLPYYLMAMLEFFTGGNIMTAYLLFVVFFIVVGGSAWLLWGLTYNRIGFCTFLGTLWFFMPDNLRIFFGEGNFPRMVINILLPYLFYFIWSFIERRKIWALVPAVIAMSCITLCHAMLAAMVGIASFIFLLIYSVGQKRMIESFYVICAMLLSFALCGIWLYPALQGGILGMESSASEIMKSLSTPMYISLNPFLREQGAISTYYYFGFSILTLSIAGLLLGDKKSRPGFYTAIIIFLGTTTAMVTFLEKLPLNQVFWMTRFTPIAYTVFLIALFEWRSCRRYAVLLIALIIVLDCIPSADFGRYYSEIPLKIEPSLTMAEKITNQRISLLDLSVYGSYPSFKISAEEPRTQYTFGWAWQGAATAHNIMMVNTALERGYYYYLFDRSLELGDDTVLINKDLVTQAKKTLSSLIAAGKASGYTFYKETNYTYIFHCETPKTFGVTADYIGLSIGDSANSITLEYPVFEEGKSNSLDDYTFKELSRYKVIYLSGFTYTNRKTAQDLLTRTANAGVKIIVDMNRIPVDPLTSRMTFFNVTAQPISFSMQYPELMYRNKIYDALPFKEEYSTWNTVYLENLDKQIGYSWFQKKRLSFLGTAGNSNIIFMGYNFLFHAMETGDKSIMSMLNNLMGLESNQLPVRTVVPLKVDYQKDKIIIDSPGGTVNTTIAYQDNFRSEQKIAEWNDLLTVKERHTEIKLVYPYLRQGLILSVIGLLGIILLIYFIYRKRGVQIEKEPCQDAPDPNLNNGNAIPFLRGKLRRHQD